MLPPLFAIPVPFDGLRSTIVSQLVYSAGASGFAAANGSMMIEVVVSQTDPWAAESPELTFFLAFLSHNGHAHCPGHWRGQATRDCCDYVGGVCIFKYPHWYDIPI